MFPDFQIDQTVLAVQAVLYVAPGQTVETVGRRLRVHPLQSAIILVMEHAIGGPGNPDRVRSADRGIWAALRRVTGVLFHRADARVR